MPTKKTGNYRVLRDHAGRLAGETIDLPPDEAALLIRDGMVALAEEG